MRAASRAPPRHTCEPLLDQVTTVTPGTVVGVDLDLLLADLTADGLVLRAGLGAEPNAFDRHGLLLHHGPLRSEGDLVLLLGDRRAGAGGAPIRLRDRLSLDGDLLTGH